MHDVIEVTCTVLGHTHLVVCQAYDWIAVSGRPWVVLHFPYSEPLPLCVYAKLYHTTRMCESMVIYYCGVVQINTMIGRDYIFTNCAFKFLSQTDRICDGFVSKCTCRLS